ncbi:MAG: hypothetical protein LQ346_004891, partial [Caloplaca aetnensis]
MEDAPHTENMKRTFTIPVRDSTPQPRATRSKAVEKPKAETIEPTSTSPVRDSTPQPRATPSSKAIQKPKAKP